MTERDLNAITQAIEKATTKANPESGKLIDFAFKAIGVVSFALVGWTLNTVNDMQQDLVRISSDAIYMRASLEKLDEFTSKPIFTKEDFESSIIPLNTIVQKNTLEIHAVEKRLNQMDLKIQQLEISTK